MTDLIDPPQVLDATLRPKSQDDFSQAAKGGCYNRRLGPFTKLQLAQLHDFHAAIEQVHLIPCSLTFEYGYSSSSAIFTLTAPEGSPDKNICIKLAEAKESDLGYSYTLYTSVDDVPHGTQHLTRYTQTREISEFVIASLRERILELSVRDFDAMESIVRDPKVTHLNGWHRKAF